MDSPTPAQWLGLAVALGAGLLVGLERERRKGRGAARALRLLGPGLGVAASGFFSGFAGGPRFAWRVLTALLLQLTAAWLAWRWVG